MSLGHLDTRSATIVLTALIAIAVGSLVVTAMGDIDPGALDRNDPPADFERYCQTVLGDDADVYLANDATTTAHNGWHCKGDSRTIHRSQIPPDVWERYQDGSVGADYVTDRLRRPPGLVGWLTWDMYGWAFGGTAVVGVGAVVAGRLWRWFTDDAD